MKTLHSTQAGPVRFATQFLQLICEAFSWSAPKKSRDQRRARDFKCITPGMSMDRVEKILGTPDETGPLTFGDDKLTTWIYFGDEGPFYVWFNTQKRVRIKSLA